MDQETSVTYDDLHEKVIESSSDAIVVIDQRFKMLSWNAFAERIFPFSRE